MTKPADALDWMEDREFEIDLGDGHWAHFLGAGGEGVTVAATGEPVPYVAKAAVVITHRQPKSPTGWCQGVVSFKPRHPNGWDVQSLDPLTISPSVLCKAQLKQADESTATCDDHGFIRGGKWVRA